MNVVMSLQFLQNAWNFLSFRLSSIQAIVPNIINSISINNHSYTYHKHKGTAHQHWTYIELRGGGGIPNTLTVLHIVKYPQSHTNSAQYCYHFNHIELALQRGNSTSKPKESNYKRKSTNSFNIKKICCNAPHSQCCTDTWLPVTVILFCNRLI
jgi:hypothetical protein